VFRGLGPLAAGRFCSWCPASIFYRTAASFHLQLSVFVSLRAWSATGLSVPLELHRSQFSLAPVSSISSLSCGRCARCLGAAQVFATKILVFPLLALPNFVSLPLVCCWVQVSAQFVLGFDYRLVCTWTRGSCIVPQGFTPRFGSPMAGSGCQSRFRICGGSVPRAVLCCLSRIWPSVLVWLQVRFMGSRSALPSQSTFSRRQTWHCLPGLRVATCVQESMLLSLFQFAIFTVRFIYLCMCRSRFPPCWVACASWFVCLFLPIAGSEVLWFLSSVVIPVSKPGYDD
jgi:hypothetical protein